MSASRTGTVSCTIWSQQALVSCTTMEHYQHIFACISYYYYDNPFSFSIWFRTVCVLNHTHTHTFWTQEEPGCRWAALPEHRVRISSFPPRVSLLIQRWHFFLGRKTNKTQREIKLSLLVYCRSDGSLCSIQAPNVDPCKSRDDSVRTLGTGWPGGKELQACTSQPACTPLGTFEVDSGEPSWSREAWGWPRTGQGGSQDGPGGAARGCHRSCRGPLREGSVTAMREERGMPRAALRDPWTLFEGNTANLRPCGCWRLPLLRPDPQGRAQGPAGAHHGSGPFSDLSKASWFSL